MPLTQSTPSLKYEGHPLVIELPPEATPQTSKRSIGKLLKKAHPRNLQPILRRISGVGNVNRRLELAQILREFLGVGNTQTIDQAGMQILRMFERYRPKVILIDRARQSDTLYVFEYLAGQIPFDDIAHVKLARLAERLSRSYCFPKRHQWEPNDPGATSARDTQNLAAVQQAEEDGFRLPNLNAFYARLTAYQNPDSSPYFMVRMLRDTLEPPLTGEPRVSAHMSDVHVRSAAQYILWNGHILFNKMDAGLAFNQPSSDFVTGGGQQPHSGLTLARWVFWRRAFQTIQHNTGYQIETRSHGYPRFGFAWWFQHEYTWSFEFAWSFQLTWSFCFA
ncbi:hypothetical protein BJX66DRAFT_336988 [Aspergillus keveii]|uniref:Uncharacterized protein n=1 Tax=Aspergillus keveii TaxID=714993 RepID=A0ABR4G8T3_9EURO